MEQTAIFFCLTILMFVLFSITFYLLIQNIFGVPYVPSSARGFGKLLRDLDIDPRGKKFIDLGSGDGRIVFTAFSHGFEQPQGIESNPLLYGVSRLRNTLGNADARFIRGNMYNLSLDDYDVIYAYLISGALKKLEPEIRSSKKSKTVITKTFKFPNLQPSRTVGDYHIYYINPSPFAG